MVIGSKALQRAIDSLQGAIQDSKSSRNILIGTQGENIYFYFSDTRKSIVIKEQLSDVNGDAEGEIIISIDELSELSVLLRGSGSLVTKDVAISLDKRSITFHLSKVLIKEVGDSGEKVESNLTVLKRTIMSQPESIKTKILTRTKYSDLLEEIQEERDSWDSQEMSSLLEGLATEKSKVVYLSPRNEAAFVANMSYMAVKKLDKSVPLVLSSETARWIASTIKRFDDQEVYSWVTRKQFCSIVGSEGNYAFWFVMDKPSSLHVSTLKKYDSKEYSAANFTFVRDVLLSVIQSVGEVSDKIDRIELELRPKELYISVFSSIASICNYYTVSNVGAVISPDVMGEDGSFKIEVSQSSLQAMLSACSTLYVGLDISVSEQGDVAVRIADIDRIEQAKLYREVMEQMGTVQLDDNTKLELREQYLEDKFYTTAARKQVAKR